MTQLIVKEYHASGGQKENGDEKSRGSNVFQDHVLHDSLETSHPDLPLQYPTASL